MTAKITPPVLPAVLDRHRLHRVLERGLGGRVTWIGGPPGCGKTTLVASHIRQSRAPCVWYQADAGDNDPASVFHWLTAATAAFAEAGSGNDLPAFSAEKTPGLRNFARLFFRALVARLPVGCVLVFDNVQEIDDDAPFHTVVREGLRELTADKHVVFLSRSDPHPLLAGFSAGRELTFLSWADLRFTDEEAGNLVALVSGRTDVREAAQRLQAIADGWAAGLILLANDTYRRSHGETVDAEASQVPSVLFDYFAAELLAGLDDLERTFLLRTAFPPILTPETAQALTGRADAGQILKRFHRRNLFIVRRDGDAPAYEYHPLFRQFLRQHVQVTQSAEASASLRLASAAALEETGDIDAAIELFIESAEWSSVERLLSQHGDSLVNQARHRTIARWLRDTPSCVLQARPWLRYWTGVAQMPTSATEALASLTECYLAFRDGGDINAAYTAWAAAAEVLVNINAYGAELDFWLDEMDVLLSSRLAPHPDDLACRVAAHMHAAIAYRRPWHPDASLWRARAIELAHRIDRKSYQVRIYLNWLQSLMCCGSAEADSIITLLDGLTRSAGCSSVDRLMGKFAHVPMHMFGGRHREAIAHAQATLLLADEEGLLFFRPLLMNFMARAHQNMGDFAASARAIDEIKALRAPLGVLADAYFFATKAAHDLLCGSSSCAAAAADAAETVLGGPALTWGHVAVYFVRAQARSDLGQHELADQDLAALFDMAQRTDNLLLLHHCHLLRAFLAVNRSDQPSALVSLRDGLLLAGNVPVCYLYVWRPPVLARLMALALEHDIEPDAAAKVIRERNLQPPRPLRPADRWPRRFRVLMLGGSTVWRDGVSIGSRHRSPLALLHCLIWHGGQEVDIDTLAGDLWPDKEGPKAQQALDVTLLRLRRLVDDQNAIIVARRTVTLAPSLWWCDLGEFREVAATILGEAAPMRVGSDAARIAALQSRLLALYRGDLLPGAVGLPGEGGADWVEDARNKTRELFARTLVCLGGAWERMQEPVEAEHCYCRAVELRPHSVPLRARLQAVRIQAGIKRGED